MPYIKFTVLKKGKLFSKPPFARQIRKLPDGNKGVAFRGKVFSLFNNSIDVSKNSYQLDDCPILSPKQHLEKDNISDENFFFLDSEYNPKFYFNGLKNDLNAFLFLLEKKKIDYLSADISENEKFDFVVKISEESKIDKNLNKKKLIDILFESIETYSSKSFQNEIKFILKQNIDSSIKKQKIQEILNQYPDLLAQDIIFDLFNQTEQIDDKQNIIEKQKKNILDLNNQLDIKNNDLKAFEELFQNKAEDEYKFSKISEQSEYIIELEKNLNFLHNENNNLKKDKEFFINTDSKKRFLNLISETFNALFPRIRLVFKSEIIIFEKYKSVLTLFKILRKIENKEDLRFKKIRTSKNWFEVDDHITTGDEKKGRVYFSPTKNDLVLVVVDFKHNNKDQILKFEKIISSNFDNIK